MTFIVLSAGTQTCHCPQKVLTSDKDCLEPLHLTVTRAADILGVTRQTLNNLVNEEAGISAEIAIRLEKAFGSSANTCYKCR